VAALLHQFLQSSAAASRVCKVQWASHPLPCRTPACALIASVAPTASTAELAACTTFPWPPRLAAQGLEKYVMSKVWRQTFGAWAEDRERDERYQRLMQVRWWAAAAGLPLGTQGDRPRRHAEQACSRDQVLLPRR